MTDTDESYGSRLSQGELIEECEVCDAPLDANEPGHFKSPDERFRHARCHKSGEPPSEPVLNIAADHPSKASVNKTFNCGHYAYGPQLNLPSKCPECGDNAV